jgi:hypothetical protein
MMSAVGACVETARARVQSAARSSTAADCMPERHRRTTVTD